MVINPSLMSKDRIITRLANMLQSGFVVTSEPNSKADVNYFFPYLEYPKSGYNKTPTAAWFTHIDYSIPSKVKEWDRVAKSVDLRITTAEIYRLELVKYGATVLVTPPLDHNLFKPTQPSLFS